MLRLESRSYRPPDPEHSSSNKLHPAENMQVAPGRLPSAHPRSRLSSVKSDARNLRRARGGRRCPSISGPEEATSTSLPDHRWCWPSRFDSHDNKDSPDSCSQSRLSAPNPGALCCSNKPVHSVCMDPHSSPAFINIRMQRMQGSGADQTSRRQTRVSFQHQDMNPESLLVSLWAEGGSEGLQSPDPGLLPGTQWEGGSLPGPQQARASHSTH